MGLPSFARRPVRIVWPSVRKDDRNNDVRVWDPPARVCRCLGWFNPGGTGDVLGSEHAASDDGTVFLPAGAPVAAGCKVVVCGAEFEVVGEPRRWCSPTGALDHVEVQVRRWLPDGR